MKSEFLCNFSHAHDTLILFISEDEENSVSEFFLSKHSMEFFLSKIHTIFITGVNDKDESLGVLVVVSPEKSDFVLSTNIPDGEFNLFVFESFYVEANCWN